MCILLSCTVLQCVAVCCSVLQYVCRTHTLSANPDAPLHKHAHAISLAQPHAVTLVLIAPCIGTPYLATPHLGGLLPQIHKHIFTNTRVQSLVRIVFARSCAFTVVGFAGDIGATVKAAYIGAFFLRGLFPQVWMRRFTHADVQSLSCAVTVTRAHVQTHAHTRTHAHAQTQTQTQTYTHIDPLRLPHPATFTQLQVGHRSVLR